MCGTFGTQQAVRSGSSHCVMQAIVADKAAGGGHFARPCTEPRGRPFPTARAQGRSWRGACAALPPKNWKPTPRPFRCLPPLCRRPPWAAASTRPTRTTKTWTRASSRGAPALLNFHLLPSSLIRSISDTATLASISSSISRILFLCSSEVCGYLSDFSIVFRARLICHCSAYQSA